MKFKHALVPGLVLGLVAAAPAFATEGYFAVGYGAVQRGQAGAGVANSDDAMSGTINPATLAGVGNELSLGVQLFMPYRGYTGTNTAFVAPGTVKSGRNYFPVPNFAYNKVLDNGAVLNFAAYGNGGMNTAYPAIINNSPGCGGNPGVFCGGKAGVDLMQLFMSVTYAQKIGRLSFGIAPTFVAQGFQAEGLGAFKGSSQDGNNLTNRGRDWSYGGGLRAGLEYELAPGLRLGLAGQTKMKMSKFKKYAGLFANGGEFDIPAAATIGLAWDARPDLTLMLDYQRIFYSGVPAVANPFPNGTAPLGSKNGPGFGWKDIGVIKLGAAWKASPRMTWRVGYAYSENPVPPSQVTLNILAPGVVRNHFSAGGSYRLAGGDQIDFALEYVPTSSVHGPEVTNAGVTANSDIKLSMHQFAATIGWTHRF